MRSPLTPGADRDDGQALPLLILVFAAAALAVHVVVVLGTASIERTRARTAADAAALTAALDGPEAARAVAAAGGAEIGSVTSAGDERTVVVELGDATASATARRIEPVVVGTGRRVGLAPAMLAALARADELLGVQVPITSGLRTRAQQQALWDRRHTNPYPVARPGSSRHETGLAVDVPSSFVPRLLAVAADAGLCRPLPRTDPIHFEVCGGRG